MGWRERTRVVERGRGEVAAAITLHGLDEAGGWAGAT
jgi:hypothetical protein